MAKETNQGETPKSQSEKGKALSINESVKDKGSGDAGGIERSRKGTAGDGTNNTGPRKTE